MTMGVYEMYLVKDFKTKVKFFTDWNQLKILSKKLSFFIFLKILDNTVKFKENINPCLYKVLNAIKLLYFTVDGTQAEHDSTKVTKKETKIGAK